MALAGVAPCGLGVDRDQAGLTQSLDLVAHGARREAGAARELGDRRAGPFEDGDVDLRAGRSASVYRSAVRSPGESGEASAAIVQLGHGSVTRSGWRSRSDPRPADGGLPALAPEDSSITSRIRSVAPIDRVREPSASVATPWQGSG
jgi:hypothetical protein